MAKKQNNFDYDLVIIGSGAGGSVAAHQLARAGKRVAIIESDHIGGECPNIGCVPTKALLQAAEIYHSTKHSSRFGIRGSTVGYNYPSIRAWKNLAVKRTGTYLGEKMYTKEGITVVHGRAHFIDPHTISVGSARFTAHNFLIATGSVLSPPPIPGLRNVDYLTFKEALDVVRPPKSLAIIGGGAIGCEFAQLFSTFNSKVHLIEMGSNLLPREDPEAGIFLAEHFAKNYDIVTHARSEVISVEKFSSKKRVLIRNIEDKKQPAKELIVDDILVATGKQAVVDIGLENANVTYTKGSIDVDEYMRTSSKHIFAAGDCVGPYQFTHTATYQSRIVAYNLLHPRNKRSADYHAIPRCIFTNPEIAMIGYSEVELKDQGINYITAEAGANVVGRANTADATAGFAKVIAEKKTGVILGATIVCPRAGEVIHELTLAAQTGLTVHHIAETIHAFPTWSELVKVVCNKLIAKL